MPAIHSAPVPARRRRAALGPFCPATAVNTGPNGPRGYTGEVSGSPAPAARRHSDGGGSGGGGSDGGAATDSREILNPRAC